MKFQYTLTIKGKNVPDFGLGPGILGRIVVDVDCEVPTTPHDAYRLISTLETHRDQFVADLVSVEVVDEEGRPINL